MMKHWNIMYMYILKKVDFINLRILNLQYKEKFIYIITHVQEKIQ